jgi:hypothetical protein
MLTAETRPLAADAHEPQRPSWECACCGAAWPCAPAKTGWRERYEHDVVELSVQMAVLLGQAAGELPGASAHDLYLRFVEWTR